MKLLKYLSKPTPANPETKHLAMSKDSVFTYKTGSDVMSTWKKTGWTPPSEYRTDYLFGSKK
jgi:hypothetical protein